MIRIKHNRRNQAGYTVLLSILVVSAVGLAISTSLILLGIGASRSGLALEQSTQARALANYCAEEALQQISDSVPFTGTDTLILGQGECTYVVESLGGQDRHITIMGTVGTIIRKVEIYLDSITPNINVTSWQEVADFAGMASDTTSPAAVSDLVASNPSSNSIDLTWTAPGDDGLSGTATSYDVRYSETLINDGNWALATLATGEPVPAIAGSTENMTVSGLDPGVTYYFAIKTSDEVPNESALSNVASETTTTTGNQADYLEVDITGVSLDPGDNKRVIGITVENTGASSIAIDRVTISWTGGPSGNNFQGISINSSVLWTGNVTTGTEVDITDFTLLQGAGSYAVDYLLFKKDMTGTTIEIVFTMSDDSTKTVANIQP